MRLRFVLSWFLGRGPATRLGPVALVGPATLLGPAALVGSVALLAACSRTLPIASDCSAHQSAATCEADPLCEPSGCPTCSGTSFLGCYDQGKAPRLPCPPGDCTMKACPGLDEASCRATPGCRADTCGGCNGSYTYVGCSKASEEPPIACDPAPAPCPPPACEQLADAECTQRAECHPVYRPADSSCPLCFDRCASGPALCSPFEPVTCDASPPNCGNAGHVLIANGCWEGCAQEGECAPEG